MSRHPNVKKVCDLLEEFGGFYTFEDILTEIQTGKMQSFTKGDSWAVTQVCNFPQKQALDVVFMVGDIETLKELELELIEFARNNSITSLMANGRKGFIREAFEGWTMRSATFVKDLNDGR